MRRIEENALMLGGLPSQDDLSRLESILQTCKEASRSQETQIHSLLRSELGAPQPLHVSLSRSLSLATEQREPFLKRISASIQDLDIRP